MFNKTSVRFRTKHSTQCYLKNTVEVIFYKNKYIIGFVFLPNPEKTSQNKPQCIASFFGKMPSNSTANDIFDYYTFCEYAAVICPDTIGLLRCRGNIPTLTGKYFKRKNIYRRKIALHMPRARKILNLAMEKIKQPPTNIKNLNQTANAKQELILASHENTLRILP